METKRRDATGLLDFHTSRETGLPLGRGEDPVRQVTDELPPAPAADLHRRAGANLRRHLVRSTIRITVLLGSDLGTFFGLRAILRACLRQSSSIRDHLGGILNWLFGHGLLRGSQFACALLVGLLVMGCYAAGDRRRDARRIFLACTLATALSLWPVLWSGSLIIALSQFAITSVLLSALLLSERMVLDLLVSKYYLGPIPARTLLVGPATECQQVIHAGAFRERTGFRVVGFVDTNSTPSPFARAPLGLLDAILRDERIDTVVLCGHMTECRFARVVRAAMASECHVMSAATAFGLAGVQPSIVWHRGMPLVELRAPVLRGQQIFFKRALDIVLAAAAVAALSPLLVLIGALIRLGSRGPVFFSQRRLGRHGRVFRCFKFRSMYIDAEERLRSDSTLFALYVANDYKLPPHLDRRITRVGRLLRRTSLDELPQLFNVLRGDMSLVGPRPIVPDELRHYDDEGPLFLSLKPGLTGAWQVNGRSSVAYPERARLELEYVQSWSLARDVGILLRTVPAVLLQRGAH